MRSSSTLDSNYLEIYADETAESEALLDNIDVSHDVELDVIPSDLTESVAGEFFMPRRFKLRHRQYLYQDINDSLAILRIIQQEAIPKRQQSYTRKITIYASITLLIVASVIVVPSVFFKQLLDIGIWQPEKEIERLLTLKREADAKWYKIYLSYTKAESDYENMLSRMLVALGKYIYAWIRNDISGKPCANDEVLVPPYLVDTRYKFLIENNIFCEMQKYYSLHKNDTLLTEFCRNTANNGCAETNRHPDIQAKIIDTRAKLVEDKKAFDVADNELKSFTRETFHEIRGVELYRDKAICLIVLMFVVMAATVLASSFLLFRSRRNYKDNMKNSSLFFENLHDINEANAIINIISRLNLKVDDTTTVTVLIDMLEAQQQNINERWKLRSAFLNGITCPSASSYSFFRQADKHVVQMILDRADLGPERRNAI